MNDYLLKIEKDNDLLNLLSMINSEINSEDLIIKDFWEMDLCAVGLSNIKNKKLVYLSVYNSPKIIEYSLEYDYEQLDSMSEIRSCNKEELLQIIKNHLEL